MAGLFSVACPGPEDFYVFEGPKACRESIKASERHTGGEGECQPAEPAAGGLQQGELLHKQPGAH